MTLLLERWINALFSLKKKNSSFVFGLRTRVPIGPRDRLSRHWTLYSLCRESFLFRVIMKSSRLKKICYHWKNYWQHYWTVRIHNKITHFSVRPEGADGLYGQSIKLHNRSLSLHQGTHVFQRHLSLIRKITPFPLEVLRRLTSARWQLMVYWLFIFGGGLSLPW